MEKNNEKKLKRIELSDKLQHEHLSRFLKSLAKSAVKYAGTQYEARNDSQAVRAIMKSTNPIIYEQERIDALKTYCRDYKFYKRMEFMKRK